MPSPDGLAARAAALKLLDSVVRKGATVEAAGFATRGLSAPDAALALAITGEALRRLPDLDAAIDGQTRQRLPDDSKARMVLRLALAQKVAMNVPDHALVATALPLVDGGPRRLVHGVLGALLRKGITVPAAPTLPPLVEERWEKAWGADTAAAASRAIAQRPPLDLAFVSDAAEAAFPDGQTLAPRHRRLADAGQVTALPGYDDGQWWVQDLAASLAARLVPADARRVLDLCAAPGGKTMQLAAAGHDVTSLDRSESRLARLSDNLLRTHLTAEVIVADALEWAAPKPYDAVLLDAPCSATGTWRRHPEVLLRARPGVIAAAAELQARLLDRAATWTAPGGTLVYAVCSLEPEEGEAQVTHFLAEHPEFSLRSADLGIGGVTPSAEGWLRILPGALEDQGGMDGFFIAHLVRSPK